MRNFLRFFLRNNSPIRFYKGNHSLKKVIKYSHAFTLIELILVMAIISILATLIFAAVDPAKRLAQARNVRRSTDVDTILTAIQEYAVDNNGKLPAGISTTEQQLGTCGLTGGNTVCTSAASNCLDLSTDLASYIKSIPEDPDGGSAQTTYYSVVADSNNIITVTSCNAELGELIQASR